jgi:hypothetical protein
MHVIGPTGLTGPTGPANFNPAVLMGPTGTTGPRYPSAGIPGVSGPPGPSEELWITWDDNSEPVPLSELGAPDPAFAHLLKRPSPPRPAGRPIPAKTPQPLTIELTRFTNADGPLTKRLSLAADGTLVKDNSACVLTHGVAERVRVAGGAALAAVIEGLMSSQMLTLGRLGADLPDKVEVTTKKKLTAKRSDRIARTGDYLVYDGPAYALLDFDGKGMPGAVAAALERVGGFWKALLTVLPELQDVARVMRASTSAGLSRVDTGAALPGSDGLHAIIAAKDGADIERFLRVLHERCWLAGFGWMVVSTSGALLERSIVDRTVGGAEHPVFEGAAILVPPLKQDEESRRPTAIDGVVLDTVAACPPLTLVDRARLDELKAKARERLASEQAKARAAFVAAQTKQYVARGMSEQAAKQAVIRQCEGILRPDIVLPFDAPELAGSTVGDVLADPERYEGETLADPLEGVAYGRCKAKIMRRADGTPWIHSFAHGRTTYALKHDATSVRKAMEKAAKKDVVEVFTSLGVVADFDAVERAELRQLAQTRSSAGLRVIDGAFKAAQGKQAAQEAEWVRAQRAARRQDPRPYIQTPLLDAEFLPVMKTLNEVLGAVGGRQPPSRDLDDDMARVRKLPVLNMHAFTQTGANAEPEEPTKSAPLPPPEQWMLCKMSEVEVTELIEKHISFYTEDKNSNRRSVHLPSLFVKHYMRRDDHILPTVAAIATSPIVLADGNMLAPDGLDRLRGIQFIIPDELRAYIPRREDCTAGAVKGAMEFLCNDWLTDVATDFTGKAVSLALALTLIERSLLPDRPTFRVTAGRRGTGKTTLIIMLILAITGMRPAAAAWSSDENERRKALFAYFMGGFPYILWDNIARGTQISCPHIEKSCTTALYADRKLGVSEAVITAASTIHIFTGNNIGMKGDLASRDLHIRLDTDRPDPENRNFTHPDPVGWTQDHRGEILHALYTILLGNPQLATLRNAAGKTRFKMWWRLVGSALEHAAEQIEQKLDFQKLFITQEEDDEESASLADVLELLVKKWPGQFTAADVAGMINNPNEDEQMVREYLLPGVLPSHVFSSKTIARLLKKHLGNPVRNGEHTLILRRQQDAHSEVFSYHVDGWEEGQEEAEKRSYTNTEHGLAQFLNHTTGSGHVIYTKHHKAESDPGYLAEPLPGRPVHVHVVRDERKILIAKKAFSDYLRKERIEGRQVMEGLVKFFSAKEVQLVLGAGTPWSRAQEAVIEIPVTPGLQLLEGILMAHGKPGDCGPSLRRRQ